MFHKKIIKQVDYLTKSDEHNLWLYDKMLEKVKELEKELEKNINLIFDYLGVHKETVNDTFLVENDYECEECEEYDDCLDRKQCLENEENWENIKKK